MVNFGPLTAEIGSGVLGTTANFNGFRVLASLLHRRRLTEVNQSLHDLWPSPRVVRYIYVFGGSCPLRNFGAKFTLRPRLAFSNIGGALLQGTRAVGVSQTLRRRTWNGIT